MTALRGTTPGGSGRNGLPPGGGYVYRGSGYDALIGKGHCPECGYRFGSAGHRLECLGLTAPPPVTHGTRGMYLRGCRCDGCRAANAAYFRERNAAGRYQQEGQA